MKSVAANDGVGDKCVRRHERGQEQRGGHTVMQKRCSQEVNEHEGNDERGQAEHHKAVFVAFKAAAVHFESGQEHDVIKAHAPEKLKRVVAFQDVEPIFAHGNACQHHADDVGNAQFAHHDGGKKDDEHHDEEYQRGVGYGEGREHFSFAYGVFGVDAAGRL